MVRLHAGGQVGVEGAAQDTRRVTVDPTRLPAVAMRASISGSPAMTPGKFMTSATPMAA